jgi:hypothetical protein
MGHYLIEKMPFPDRTERFNWEDYEDGSPILLKIRSLGPIWRSMLIRNGLFVVVLGVAFGVLLTVMGSPYPIARAVFGTALVLAAIATGGAIGLVIYRKKLEIVESDNVRDAVFQHNFTKWAVARYDFSSEEDFFTMLKGKDGTRCYLAEGGPLSGLLVSSVTGNEWALK